MEQTTPFDGVMFKVDAKDRQGGTLSSEAIGDGRPWKREWLQEALVDLKSCRFARFTDNFLRFNATPGNLDWADDAGWAALADKAGHCAWLLKQTGCKGLAIDFESYGAHQFRFDAAPPPMVLVDGCENGYYMDSAEEYLCAAHELRSWNGGAIRRGHSRARRG